jgi:transcriptional regulator with XRE-family HTH domain
MGPMSPDTWKAALGQLGAFIRAQRTAAGLSLRELADRTELSNAYLSQLERGLHEPSITVLKAIGDALGVGVEALLAEAGALDAAPADGGPARVVDTEAAIANDPHLSEPQRIALLSVYRSFVPPRRARSRRA